MTIALFIILLAIVVGLAVLVIWLSSGSSIVEEDDHNGHESCNCVLMFINGVPYYLPEEDDQS